MPEYWDVNELEDYFAEHPEEEEEFIEEMARLYDLNDPIEMPEYWEDY